jgi:dipeptidyl aminopeptidase/acylaminoacyl peptidase
LDPSGALDIVDKVIKIPTLQLQGLSPDGKFAVILSDMSGSYQLWSVATGTGVMKQLSHGNDRVTYSDVSPDSKRVAFTRDFAGAERHEFFLVPITGGGEEAQVSDLKEVRANDFSWSPDGKEIAFCGSTPDSQKLWALNPQAKKHQELYSAKGWIFSPAYSPGRRWISASAKTTDYPRSMELLLVNRRSGGVETYSPELGSENSGAKWHPAKETVLFKTNAGGHYDLAIYDLPTRSLTRLGVSRLGRDFVAYGWAKKGDAVWFVAAKNGRTRLYIKGGGGAPKAIPTPRGRMNGAKMNKDGTRFLFSWSSLSTPPQLSRLDLRSRKISTVHRPTYDRSLPLGRAEFLTYRSTDGLKIPAFMVFRGTKEPGPLVVWPHGGPWWEVADEWNPAIQSICASGFHVFCPNFRGSTGYGSEFERLDLGDPGGMDLQDVVEGAKLMTRKGYVKDGKIGIAGASYGGFMTFLCMTKVPEMWKAGAAIVGVTDWKEMYELSDAAFREFIVELLGPPEKNEELFRDRSAINFVSQIRAPILIWHRANDSRCPLRPVQKFAEQLRALGKPHEMHVVEGEGHGLQKTESLARQYRGVVSFLLNYLA